MLRKVVANTIAKTLSGITYSKAIRGLNMGCTPTSLRFGFAEEKSTAVEGGNSSGDSRSAVFYRSSIRRINIDSRGRGKFTQHHLLKLTSLTKKPEQQALLFEAYYNYLGHFTIIDSKVVDKMLARVMSFQNCGLQKILQVYSNHNYLTYFPHYETTRQFLSLASKNDQILSQLLNILIVSPLIKFNTHIVEDLAQALKSQSTSQTNFSLIVKLLVSRQNHKLLEGILTRTQLLKHLTSAFQDKIQKKTFKPIRRSSIISQWIVQTEQSQVSSDQLHFDLAVLSLSTGLGNVFGDQLVLIKQQGNVKKAVSYLQECPQSYRSFIVNYLQNLEISQELRLQLAEFGTSEGEASESTPAESQ